MMIPQSPNMGLSETEFRDAMMEAGFFIITVKRETIVEDAMKQIVAAAASNNPASTGDILKKGLKVKFEGEPGLDDGGLSKEFFRLITEKLFSPQFGMFTENPDTNALWFNLSALSHMGNSETDFYNLGLLMGLAVYNNIPGISVPFPKVFFKKLANEGAYSLKDLEQIYPSYVTSISGIMDWKPENIISMDSFGRGNRPNSASSVIRVGSNATGSTMNRDSFARLNTQQRLAANEEFEEIMCLDFTTSYSTPFGETATVELKPDGKNINVNYENREEFCSLLQNWALHESVKSMFVPLQMGFQRVCSDPDSAGGSNSPTNSPTAAAGTSSSQSAARPRRRIPNNVNTNLSGPTSSDNDDIEEVKRIGIAMTLDSSELELIICGNRDLDFKHLREGAVYTGYDIENNPDDKKYIDELWQVLENFPLPLKKEFLRFVTGSDLAPVGGLKGLKMKIQKNGSEPTTRLPTASTCYNILLLPRYLSIHKLEWKLRVAIGNAEGFGLE